MKFSIIIPTVGRADQLERLLYSIEKQTFQDFEIIVVDQNKEHVVDEVIKGYRNKYNLHHVKHSGTGAALARNTGSKVSTGEILFWPDDDCILLQNTLLEWAAQEFKVDQGLSGLIAIARDYDGVAFHRWIPTTNRLLTKMDALTSAIEWTLFIRRDVFIASGGFDVDFGTGSKTEWQAGESSDLCIRLLDTGHRIMVSPKVFVNHPNPEIMLNNITQLKKAQSYAKGMGAVAKKNQLSIYLIVRYVATYFRALLWNVIQRKKANVRYHWARLRGVLAGLNQYRSGSQ